MIKCGIVSVTFRSLSVDEIIQLTADCGLDGIEWGGDVHVPHGQIELAQEVAQKTADAGLAPSAYGSYYKVGHAMDRDGNPLEFATVIETAQALGTDLIRVWPGNCNSEDADPDYRQQVTADAQRIAALAEAAGCRVAFEYHNNSLTNTPKSALQLVADVDQANCGLFWQTRNLENHDTRLADLHMVLEHVTNIHVFHWLVDADGFNRYPLADGIADWQRYLQVLTNADRDFWASLEFVAGDTIEQFKKDAATLRALITP